MDLISIDRIKTLHPKVRDKALAIYKHINNKLLGKGVRLRFVQVYRSFAEQDALYAQGRTKPGDRVTDAKGGMSYHNYGLAIDFALLIDKNGDGNFEEVSWDTRKDFDADGIPDWMEVVNYFESQGWSWGGRWRKPDKPHFEMNFGYDERELLVKVKAGDTFTEKIGGKLYTYVNL